jgi:hypothetical protein
VGLRAAPAVLRSDLDDFGSDADALKAVWRASAGGELSDESVEAALEDAGSSTHFNFGHVK